MAITGQQAHVLKDTGPLAKGQPEILAREFTVMVAGHSGAVDAVVDDVLSCLRRAVTLPEGSMSVAVVGCGRLPGSVRRLSELAWACVGIESLSEFAASARRFLSCWRP